MAAANDVLMNKRFEEAFDFIKYVFKVGKHYDDQMRLIKAFCNRSNVFFNAIFIFICNMFVICINYYYAFDQSYVCITRNLRILYSPLTTGEWTGAQAIVIQLSDLRHKYVLALRRTHSTKNIFMPANIKSMFNPLTLYFPF